MATQRADKVCGIHFFNPAPAMKLVEIDRPLTASDETIAAATEFAVRCGKEDAVQGRRPCRFRRERCCLFPYLNNAVRLWERAPRRWRTSTPP